MKLKFPLQSFEKYSNIKFKKISPVGTELFHAYKQTDRHNEANCRYSQFLESTWCKD